MFMFMFMFMPMLMSKFASVFLSAFARAALGAEEGEAGGGGGGGGNKWSLSLQQGAASMLIRRLADERAPAKRESQHGGQLAAAIRSPGGGGAPPLASAARRAQFARLIQWSLGALARLGRLGLARLGLGWPHGPTRALALFALRANSRPLAPLRLELVDIFTLRAKAPWKREREEERRETLWLCFWLLPGGSRQMALRVLYFYPLVVITILLVSNFEHFKHSPSLLCTFSPFELSLVELSWVELDRIELNFCRLLPAKPNKWRPLPAARNSARLSQFQLSEFVYLRFRLYHRRSCEDGRGASVRAGCPRAGGGCGRVGGGCGGGGGRAGGRAAGAAGRAGAAARAGAAGGRPRRPPPAGRPKR